MNGNPTLRFLLGWAHRQYVLETPELQHTLSRVGDDGDPDMSVAARFYLGLSKRGQSRDNWFDISSQLDDEGRYRTPLRAALARIRDANMRLFLRDLVPELYRPTDIADIHAIPPWARTWVMHGALLALWHEYLERPPIPVGWVSMSDSQRSAVVAGEVA